MAPQLCTWRKNMSKSSRTKVLVIASDIARYSLASGGEVTQGVGAVAMMITQTRVFYRLKTTAYFWQKISMISGVQISEFPVVDGPLSNSTYIESFQKFGIDIKNCRVEDSKIIRRLLSIFRILRWEKALQSVLDQTDEENQERLMARYEESIRYSRRIGNLYTGSLYLGLTSLLENSKSLQPGDRIGLFSYGSGAVSEFYRLSGRKLSRISLRTISSRDARFSNTDHCWRIWNDFQWDASWTRRMCRIYFRCTFSITKIENDIRYYKI